MKWLGALIAAWTLAASPALAALTATQAGSASAASSAATLAITGVTCPQGNTLAIAAGSNAEPPVSAADGSNTYAVGYVINNGTSLYGGWLSAYMSAGLSSATVTVTYTSDGSATTARTATAWCLAGVYTRDINGTGAAAASGTTASLATGTLASSSEIDLGFTITSSSVSAYSATGLTNAGTQVAAAPYINTSYQVATATASITYVPSWTSSRANVVNLISFEAGAGPGATSGCAREQRGDGC